MFKNLFLLFVSVTCLCLIKVKHQEDLKRLVRLDVAETLVVDKTLTLHIPRSIKFGDKVINAKRPGLVILTVCGKTFYYRRPVELSRNEYLIDYKKSHELRLVNVTAGDKIVFNFNSANIKTGNVPMYGEEIL